MDVANIIVEGSGENQGPECQRLWEQDYEYREITGLGRIGGTGRENRAGYSIRFVGEGAGWIKGTKGTEIMDPFSVLSRLVRAWPSSQFPPRSQRTAQYVWLGTLIHVLPILNLASGGADETLSVNGVARDPTTSPNLKMLVNNRDNQRPVRQYPSVDGMHIKVVQFVSPFFCASLRWNISQEPTYVLRSSQSKWSGSLNRGLQERNHRIVIW